jgi:hypothetical protein
MQLTRSLEPKQRASIILPADECFVFEEPKARRFVPNIGGVSEFFIWVGWCFEPRLQFRFNSREYRESTGEFKFRSKHSHGIVYFGDVPRNLILLDLDIYQAVALDGALVDRLCDTVKPIL